MKWPLLFVLTSTVTEYAEGEAEEPPINCQVQATVTALSEKVLVLSPMRA